MARALLHMTDMSKEKGVICMLLSIPFALFR